MIGGGSLRWRLVTWYVIVAAVVMIFIAALGGFAVFEMASNNTRAMVAAETPIVHRVLTGYLRVHRSPIGLESYIRQQLRPLGLEAHVAPFPPSRFPAQRFPSPRFRQEYQLFTSGDVRIEKRPTFPNAMWLLWFMRAGIQPEHIRVDGVDVLLFGDPMRLADLMNRYIGAAATVFAIVMLLAWFAANAVARHTLDPLLKTTRALSRFAEGDFTPEPVRTADRSELGDLARAYNGAVQQITRAFDERSKAEAEMRQFVADAGHQLRTPLTVIMGHLSGFAAKTQSPRDAVVYNSMLAQSRRMKGLIADLITLARLEQREIPMHVIDANLLVKQAVDPFMNAGHERIVMRAADRPAIIMGHGEDLFGAVSALIDNALKYAPDGIIEVSVDVQSDTCEISVADRGPGMNEADIAKAFDRFFRGESASEVAGTGLGLAIVRKCAQRAGGTATISNRRGGGLDCSIRVPLVDDGIPDGLAREEVPAHEAS
jgi:signal transduction histidine kinase